MRHTHYLVLGYERRDDQGNLHDSCEFDVIADTEAAAVERAKELCVKGFYRINRVFEHDPNLEVTGTT